MSTIHVHGLIYTYMHAYVCVYTYIYSIKCMYFMNMNHWHMSSYTCTQTYTHCYPKDLYHILTFFYFFLVKSRACVRENIKLDHFPFLHQPWPTILSLLAHWALSFHLCPSSLDTCRQEEAKITQRKMRQFWGRRREVLSVYIPFVQKGERWNKSFPGGTFLLVLLIRVTEIWNFCHRGGGGHRGPNNVAGIDF